jgi:hypothetical protein
MNLHRSAVSKLPGALLICAAAFVQGPASASAQQDVASFVLRIGDDTVSVEQYTRTATSLSGRQVLRTPRTIIRDYSAALDANGHAASVEVSFTRPGEAAPMTRAHLVFGTDTAVVTIHQGDSTRIVRVPATAGAIPFIGYSIGLYELPLARLRSTGTTGSTALVPIGAATTSPLTLASAEGDWVTLTNFTGENRVRVDPAGRIVEWDGTGSTLKLHGERSERLDLDALIASFMERERAGELLGTLSPRDSTLASLAGASIRIDYSSPARRGRTIAGEVVPWDVIWRTGANQATLLTTDRDLQIGDAHVPAGTYSVWTLPQRSGSVLILNRQHGQWGTEYDAAQDLARIPMMSEPALHMPERFTISLDTAGDAGRLILAWGDLHLWVPVRTVP